MIPPPDEPTKVNQRFTQPRVLRRGVVVLPSGLTLANLFCGVYAIVSASRGQFDLAGLLVAVAVAAAVAKPKLDRRSRDCLIVADVPHGT